MPPRKNLHMDLLRRVSRLLTYILMPSLGRSVTRCFGATDCPLTRSNRKARMRLARTMIASDGGVRHPLHGRGEVRDLSGRKKGRKGPPLQAPGLALRPQQAVSEARTQDPQLQIILAVVRSVVEKDLPDRGGIVRRGAQAEDRTSDQDRPFEMPGSRSRSGSAATSRSSPASRAASRIAADRGERRAERKPTSTSTGWRRTRSATTVFISGATEASVRLFSMARG